MTSSSISGKGTDLAALMVGKGMHNDFGAHVVGKAMPHRYNRGTAPQNCNKGSTSQSTSQYCNKGKKNWDQKCDYCRLQGHVEVDCFRLDGYQHDWKSMKKGVGNNAYNV
ncbi:hypothetical protein KY290_024807 [Solanum tuberosum]|uniref:Gag-pol polyprotein n=1 Tax=Solanum tuberosum TaxID=4113 RepID=A0ABQ7UTQ7_SOLTU|nr:hypothetical protein KY284_023662 [Solanum tuberosum]KAH0754537.1 hypothetical protein KY290_024807 [Solanum tuberosum]